MTNSKKDLEERELEKKSGDSAFSHKYDTMLTNIVNKKATRSEVLHLFSALARPDSGIHRVLYHATSEEYNALINLAIDDEETKASSRNMLYLLQEMAKLNELQQAQIVEENFSRLLQFAQKNGEPVDRQLIKMVSDLKEQLTITNDDIPILIDIAKEHRTTSFIMLEALTKMAESSELSSKNQERFVELIESALRIPKENLQITVNSVRLNGGTVTNRLLTFLKSLHASGINPLEALQLDDLKLLAKAAIHNKDVLILTQLFEAVKKKPEEMKALINLFATENAADLTFDEDIWQSWMQASERDSTILNELGKLIFQNKIKDNVLTYATTEDWSKFIKANLDSNSGSVRRVLHLITRQVDAGHDISAVIDAEDWKKLIHESSADPERAKILLQLAAKLSNKISILQLATNEELNMLMRIATQSYPEGVETLLESALLDRITPQEALTLLIEPVNALDNKKEAALFYLLSKHPQAVPGLLKKIMLLPMDDTGFMNSCALIVSTVYHPGATLEEMQQSQKGASREDIQEYNAHLREWVFKDPVALRVMGLLLIAYDFNSKLKDNVVKVNDPGLQLQYIEAYEQAKALFKVLRDGFHKVQISQFNITSEEKNEIRKQCIDKIRETKADILALDKPRSGAHSFASRIKWMESMVADMTNTNQHSLSLGSIFSQKSRGPKPVSTQDKENIENLGL